MKSWKSIEHTIERCSINLEDKTNKVVGLGFRPNWNLGMMEYWNDGILRDRNNGGMVHLR